jgi:hypothetical protein
MAKPVAYILFNHEMDWECRITAHRHEAEALDGFDGWRIGGEVNTLEEVFNLLDDNDFDPEYFYNFVELMPHWLYNALNH